MNNMIFRLRAAASLLNDAARDEMNTVTDALEQNMIALVKAQTPNDVEIILRQLNGLWARAKEVHLRLTRKPLYTLKKP